MQWRKQHNITGLRKIRLSSQAVAFYVTFRYNQEIFNKGNEATELRKGKYSTESKILEVIEQQNVIILISLKKSWVLY